jgi:hypothetical protein
LVPITEKELSFPCVTHLYVLLVIQLPKNFGYSVQELNSVGFVITSHDIRYTENLTGQKSNPFLCHIRKITLPFTVKIRTGKGLLL